MSGKNDLSLEEAFQIFTVAELKELCKSIGIQGISYLRKRELIHRLVASLTDLNMFRQYCLFARPSEIKAFELALQRPIVTEDQYEELYYWLQYGYCFMEENSHVVVMEEIRELYQELGDDFWKKHKKLHHLIQYIDAAVHFYGVIELSKFVELYNQWNEEKTTELEIRHLYHMLEERPELCEYDIEENLLLDDVLLDEESGYFAYEGVYEQQRTKPYYTPKKEEFLRYEDPDYVERTKEYKILLEYLIEVYQTPEYIAEDICDDLVHSIRFGYMIEDVMKDLEKKGIHFDQFRSDDLANLILQLMNHTRTMFYRGHTPIEIGAEVSYEIERKRSRRFVYQGKHIHQEQDRIIIPFPGNSL